ncbi:hypothetical protein OG233_30770 (plasmid) [Streptomyces sp. NBC_01218]|uniref:hypothetical protein n=1 Tax=Streptomyces sp. NBC_01218 TaxID=2903780 RepID=UPI002E102D38|nr:hypothetical protein OG233_30770 [Streptomyces sp. NBC_01218]
MQQTLSLDRFRDQHGSPDRWTAADIDSYVVIGDIAPPAPLPYTHAEMQSVSAVVPRAMADQLREMAALAGDTDRRRAG